MNKIREAVEFVRKWAMCTENDELDEANETLTEFAERMAWLVEAEGYVTTFDCAVDTVLGRQEGDGTLLENLDAACRAVAKETGKAYP